MDLLALAWSSEWVHWGTDTSTAICSSNGEMLVGMPSREASASSTLAWDDMSMGGSETSDFPGGDIVTAVVVIFSREECLDSQLDAYYYCLI